MPDRVYIACDLKSFYASVECIERGLDPLSTNLVVADKSRTEKTICLAVSPSLKAYGISGRARLFEVVQKVTEVNAQRQRNAPGRQFTGSSWNDPEVKRRPELALDYLAAPPRMAHYIEWSTKIYNIYLKYVAPSDIHVYSIDEVLMDVTNYLPTYRLTPRELARKIVLDVLDTTGITATAGIGSNLYLAKVAMDIWAKHTKPDKNGVRIAELDELSYRRLLWEHRPLTDFWRVGRGYAKKLEAQGLFTMGDRGAQSVMGAYDDIINLPHPTSPRHPRMPMIDRAAQFTPFQALTGYGDAIQETARITGEKVELTEEEKAVLDEKLRFLADTGNEAAFTYFQPDGKKSGGAYVTALGAVKKLDPLEGRLTLTDGTGIPIEDILEIGDGRSAGFPLKEARL